MHILIRQFVLKGSTSFVLKAVVVAIAAVLSIGLASAAGATASPLAGSRAQTAVAAVHPETVRAAALSAPSGCPSGAVCFYKKGNGGDLCGIWYGNAPTLGGCANTGPSGSIFNNGQACNGCDGVNLYWGGNYSGAYYCLPRGHYLLYIEQDHFDRGSGSGLGQTLAYRPGLPGGPGGVASAKWTSC